MVSIGAYVIYPRLRRRLRRNTVALFWTNPLRVCLKCHSCAVSIAWWSIVRIMIFQVYGSMLVTNGISSCSKLNTFIKMLPWSCAIRRIWICWSQSSIFTKSTLSPCVRRNLPNDRIPPSDMPWLRMVWTLSTRIANSRSEWIFVSIAWRSSSNIFFSLLSRRVLLSSGTSIWWLKSKRLSSMLPSLDARSSKMSLGIL